MPKQHNKVKILLEQRIAFPPNRTTKFYEDYRNEILKIFKQDYPGKNIAVGYSVEYDPTMNKDVMQLMVVRAAF